MATVTILPGTGHLHSQEQTGHFTSNENGHRHAKQKCTSATCCSPSRIWRSIQQLIGDGNKQDLIKLCQDPARSTHVLRVLLTSRLTNDASLYPASNKHRIVQLRPPPTTATTDQDKAFISPLLFRSKVHATFGKLATDLNALQLALFHRQESMACYLLQLVRQQASDKELRLFVNHLWGTRNGSLHLACFLGMPRVVQLLLEMGMAPDAVNGKLKSPLECCLDGLTMHRSPSPSLLDCRTLIEQALMVKHGEKMSVDSSSLPPPPPPTPSSADVAVVKKNEPIGGDGNKKHLDVPSTGGGGGSDKPTDTLVVKKQTTLNEVPPRLLGKNGDRTSSVAKPVNKGVCSPSLRKSAIVPPSSTISHWAADSYMQVHSLTDGAGVCLVESSPAFLYRHEHQLKQRQDGYGLDPLQSMTLGISTFDDDDDDDDDDDNDDDDDGFDMEDQDDGCWSPPLLPLDDVSLNDDAGKDDTGHLDDELDQDTLALPDGVISSEQDLICYADKGDPCDVNQNGALPLNGMVMAVDTRFGPEGDACGAPRKMESTADPGNQMHQDMDMDDGGSSDSGNNSSATLSLFSGATGVGYDDDDNNMNRRKRQKHHRHRVRFDPKVVLMEACVRGDLKEVEQVIRQHQVDTSWLLYDHHGGAGFQDRTLLQLALMHGHESLVHYLVKKVKVNINQVDADGWTAAHYAAALGQWKNMEYLASSDLINLFAQTDDGFLIQDCPKTEVERFRCRFIGRALQKIARSAQISGSKCISAKNSRLGVLHSPSLVGGHT